MRKNFYIVTTLAALLLASCGGKEQSAQTESKATEIAASELTFPEVNTPEEAIARLKEGNARYVADHPVFPHHDLKRVHETAPHQTPFAAVVTCSDSRVPAELIFDQGVGDIFVIRTAGNTVNDGAVMGSVDYAIEHLGVKVVVVMGHESCGGVTGAISEIKPDDESMVDELLSIIQADVKEYVGQPDKLDEAIRLNAATQVKRIADREGVKKYTEAGKTKIIGAYYNVHDGSVSFDGE